MASSRASNAVNWSASPSTTLAGSAVTSDAFLFDVEDWQASLQVNADNAGTPASGDWVDVWVAYTPGDTLGNAGTHDYDSTEHATYLGRLDTYATNTPGEDPARASYDLMTAPLGFKLILFANQGATRNVVCRAMVCTHRPQ